MVLCEWFLDCSEESVGTVEHPTLGDIEICQRHHTWLTTDYSPTKLVPPLAAKHGRRLRASLARLEEGSA